MDSKLENETVHLGNELFRNKDENRQRLNGKWLAVDFIFFYFILFFPLPYSLAGPFVPTAATPNSIRSSPVRGPAERKQSDTKDERKNG